MKRKLSMLILLFWSLNIIAQNSTFYSLSLNDIDGNTISMNTYQGKRLMIYIAPFSSTDNALFKDIDSFQTMYGDSIKILGVMSNEEGYIDSNNAQVKAMYVGIGVNILLTSGMYTQKNAGTNQSNLMKWLTNKNLNLRFNLDAKGTGQKFFIDKRGGLFAVLPPEIPLTSPILSNYVHKN